MADTCVLVVDDEASVATTIEAILKMDGHDVLAVTSGTEAIRLLNERQFDVVLTDLRLADVDGIDILKEVQRTAPDTAAPQPPAEASIPAPSRRVVAIEHQDSQGTRQQSTSDVLGTSSGRREE